MHKLIEHLEIEDCDFANSDIDSINLYFTYDDIKDISVQDLLTEANNPTLHILTSMLKQNNKINECIKINDMENNTEGFV